MDFALLESVISTFVIIFNSPVSKGSKIWLPNILYLSLEGKQVAGVAFQEREKNNIKISGELTRLGDKMKSGSRLSCLSNTFSPLDNSFLSSVLL